MEVLDIALLAAAAFCTSALTVVVGAGGGMLLLALMLQIMAPVAAIPVHGCVQLASNTTRTWLLRVHVDRAIAWRFAVLMPVGVSLGLLAFQGLPAVAVNLLIGCFVVSTLFLGRLRASGDSILPLGVFLPAGLVTGALNMVVGVIGPVLGVLISWRPLSKEAVVGTLGFFGVLGNALKIAGFSMVGFAFADHLPLIAAMIPAAILGSWTGRRLLAGMDQRLFRAAFQTVLIILALKLIVVDGVLVLTG